MDRNYDLAMARALLARLGASATGPLMEPVVGARRSGGRSGPMRANRFSQKQIVQSQRQAEARTPLVQVCRKSNVSDATFFRWKGRFAGLDVSEVRALRQVRKEERKFEQVTAELTLGKRIPCEALRKRG